METLSPRSLEECTPHLKAHGIGCGCHDKHACPGGCYWLRVNYEEHLGVCNCCPADAVRWDAGDDTFAPGVVALVP